MTLMIFLGMCDLFFIERIEKIKKINIFLPKYLLLLHCSFFFVQMVLAEIFPIGKNNFVPCS